MILSINLGIVSKRKRMSRTLGSAPNCALLSSPVGRLTVVKHQFPHFYSSGKKKKIRFVGCNSENTPTGRLYVSKAVLVQFCCPKILDGIWFDLGFQLFCFLFFWAFKKNPNKFWKLWHFARLESISTSSNGLGIVKVLLVEPLQTASLLHTGPS